MEKDRDKPVWLLSFQFIKKTNFIGRERVKKKWEVGRLKKRWGASKREWKREVGAGRQFTLSVVSHRVARCSRNMVF